MSYPNPPEQAPASQLPAFWLQLLELLRARLVLSGFSPEPVNLAGAGCSNSLKLHLDPLCCLQHCPVQGPRHRHGIAIPLGHPARGQQQHWDAGVIPTKPVQGQAWLLCLIWAMQGGSLQGGFQWAGKQQPDGTQIPAQRHPLSRVCTAWMLICSREGFSLHQTSAAGLGRHPCTLAGLLHHPTGQVPASGVWALLWHGRAGRYHSLISHSQGPA